MYNFTQAQIFLLFLIIGIGIGIFFDIFRAIRKNFKSSDFITSIEDLIFMAVIGIVIVNSLVVLNQGQLRFFIILALLFGITFYFLTISKICFFIFETILRICKKMIYYPIYLIRKKKK